MTGEIAARRADETLHKLAGLCAPEIAEALNEFKESGNLLIFDLAEFPREVAVIGVREAAQTLRDEPGRSLLEHIKVSVINVLKDAEVEQREQLRSLPPSQLLDIVLRLTRLEAAWVLDHLSFDQRNALIGFIHHRMGSQYVEMRLGDKHEPDDPLMWAIWYLGRLHALEPQAKQAFTKEGRPLQTCFLIDPSRELGPQPKNRGGEPINLAGPALVKVFEALTGLLTNRIPAEASSKSKLGRSFRVSRKVIARWRQHPEWEKLHIEITPDGKGGVYYAIDQENQLRSAHIATGIDRGPKKAK